MSRPQPASAAAAFTVPRQLSRNSVAASPHRWGLVHTPEFRHSVLQRIPKIRVPQMADFQRYDELIVVLRPAPALHLQAFFYCVRTPLIRKVKEIAAAFAFRVESRGRSAAGAGDEKSS